jgi:murein DD-endopeptidase MepM/ murein hydrolase activator NlpD
MGYTDPPPREPVDDNDGWPTVRSLVSRGAEKLKRANYRRTGAVTGSIAAVALVSLGTTLSANATTSSSEVYARQFTASSVDDRETQSLQVSATSEGPALIHRADGIYKPDMIWPTVGGAGVTISSGFGYRPAPCDICSTDHRGLDMNPGYGTEIFSATSGTVVSVGWNGSLGWEVLVQDEGNRQYVYGHMVADSAPADVFVGAKVKQGQVIGLVGSTGTSTGPHLHFEIVEDGVQIDPYPELLKYAR